MIVMVLESGRCWQLDIVVYTIRWWWSSDEQSGWLELGVDDFMGRRVTE